MKKTIEDVVLPDEHPAKQGLKLKALSSLSSFSTLPDEHPAKQGLKLHYFRINWYVHIILPDEHPAKQGLKQDYPQVKSKVDKYLPDEHPAKQGLKLKCIAVNIIFINTPGRTSSKTRIETTARNGLTGTNFYSRTNIQQNKD